MPRKRAVLLTFLACLLAAAPAAASERSEARKYAAAMQPLTFSPEEAEALIAGVEARAAHVAATCMDAVRAVARKERRAFTVWMIYAMHITADVYARQATWLRAGDERLAAIPTSSRTLRRGRAARRVLTRFIGRLPEAVPSDFCAFLTGWQAKGFKGAAPGLEALDDAIDDVEDDRWDGWLRAATKALKRHGATRAQRHAFGGTPVWPEFREPAPDPVAEALSSGGDDQAGRRSG